MGDTARPDLLPLARAVRLGLPFHGQTIAANSAPTVGTLTLADSTTMTYPQPDGTDLTWVSHPAAAAPVRTAAEIAHDTAKHYEWVQYAYLSGTYRDIGGHSLGQYSWLFCTTTRTYVITLSSADVGGQSTLVVKAREFGRFGVGQSIDATIGTHAYDVLDYDDAPTTAGFGKMTHSKTGAVTVVNFDSSEFTLSFRFAGAIKIQIGNDLACTFTDLCFGSQIATDDHTYERVDGLDLNLPCATMTWVNRWDPIGGDVYGNCLDYQESGSYVYSEWEYYWKTDRPAVGYNYDYHEVSAKLYYFVLADGIVDHFSISYWYGSRADSTTTIWSGAESGWAECDGGTNSSSPNVPKQMGQVETGRTGLEFSIGSLTVKAYYDGGYDLSATYTMKFYGCSNCSGGLGEYQSDLVEYGDIDLVCNGTTDDYVWDSGGYDPLLTGEIEALTKDDQPKVEVYNNNIIDILYYQALRSGQLHYVCSLCINGETFSRLKERDGDDYILLPAIYDQRTDTIIVGTDPDETLSIV
jgi:hypothetical protein